MNTNPLAGFGPGEDLTNETARAMNRWLLEALDHVASVGLAQTETEEEAESALFAHAGGVLFRVGPFESGAFFLLDPASADFPLAWSSPPAKQAGLEAELERLIDDGVFAWALQRNHPVLVPAGTTGGSAMLHVLATRSGPVGMFLGLITERMPFIPDGCQKLISIVLTSCAAHLRSEQLRTELRGINRGLETTIKARTAELVAARDLAHQASQAKTEFLANMSHEIRTPMNAVLGTTAMLLESPLSEEQQSLAELIARSGRDLLTIINDILDFSKLEAGKLRVEAIPFDLPEVARATVAVLTPKAEAKQIRLGLKLADGVPSQAIGDPGRLRQVLTNLTDNAIKFTEHGFVLLHLSAQPPRADGLVEVAFVIRDSGVGIPADKLATIFDKFTQADTSTTRKFGGTGLGLAICRQLAELMGGTITAESSPGGSTFVVTVPFQVAEAGAAAGAPDAPSAHRFSGRVLLAEDYPANQRIARWMLERLGLEVEIAGDGRQTLDRLGRERFDLVLMDCQMPEMDGYEATRAIRASGEPWAAVPIVAMTAAAMPADRERCLAAGMNDYVSKPVQVEALARALARFLAPPPG